MNGEGDPVFSGAKKAGLIEVSQGDSQQPMKASTQ